VAYTSFLNSLKSKRFKSSLAKQKESTLAEALRKATNFIRATEICAEGANASKKTKVPVDRNHGQGDRRPRLEGVDPRFTTDPRSILTKVRGHPMLKRPPPMTLPPKPYNAWKYYEFHEQNGHVTAEFQELRKALHELADKGQIDQCLKRGLHFLQEEHESTQPEPQDEECST